MATAIRSLQIGIDVSKASLDICLGPDQPVQTIQNTPGSIRRWLRSLPVGNLSIALEATNTYHLEIALQACQAGHALYLIDGYRLSRYRDSVGQRAKTDLLDAQLLQRYLCREQDQLRPWSPPPAAYSMLQRLLRQRAQLVRARVALQQGMQDIPGLKRSVDALIRRIRELEQKILQRMQTALENAGWDKDVQRCQAIEGIGPVSATSLVTTFHRGNFRSSDAFIAFLGLDVRARDSGQWRGRRKLSKKGDPEVRRVLYLAAMQASRSARWKPLYLRYQQRGFSKIQALVILARKLARIAFALMKNQTVYQPDLSKRACLET